MTGGERATARFATEAALCAAYSEFATASGWVVYPETAGFDLLLVRPEGDPHAGTQIGVEAKLKLNAKVVDQILDRTPWDLQWERAPDYRVVLVADPGRSHGIARMLSRCGITTVAPELDAGSRHGGSRIWPEDDGRTIRWPGWYVVASHDEVPWTDLNPAQRCELPEFVPDVAAGVPSPRTLSRWKIAALRVVALLELDGGVTRPEIKAQGCDPSRWTRGADAWLDPVGKGRFVRSDRLPRFEQHHPEVFAKVRAELLAARETGEGAAA